MSFHDAKIKIKSILEGILVRNLVEDPNCTSGSCLSLDSGLSVAIDTSQKVVGSGSFLITSSAGGANKTVLIQKSDGFSKIAATAGSLYTHAVYLKRGAGGAADITGRMGIEWYDASEVLISREYGDGITANATITLVDGADWVRESYTAVAPALTAFAIPFFEDHAGSWISGRDVYFDAWMFNQGGLEDYIDGTMPGCAWEGTANSSTSKRAVKRVYESPPNNVQDFPCFIMFPAGQDPERLPGGWRKDVYEINCRLAAHDSDWDRASVIMEAYRELVVNAFDGSIQLGGHADVITGPRIPPEGVGVFQHTGPPYIGMNFIFTVRTSNGRAAGFVS